MPARTAKDMQAVTIAPPSPIEEVRIRVTLRTVVGFEYHEVYPAQVVQGLLDPDVDDTFIAVTIPDAIKAVKIRYLHTSTIAEIDLHDELPPLPDVAEKQATNGANGKKKAG